MTDDDKALVERLREENEWTNQRPYFHAHAKSIEAADRIEALSAENERLQKANRFLRRGLYGLMDSDDADDIATTIEAGGIVDWDKYPPSARVALGDTE